MYNIIRYNCRMCTVSHAVIDGFMLSEKWNGCIFCRMICDVYWVECAVAGNSGICT
jgi:hypothetical protein